MTRKFETAMHCRELALRLCAAALMALAVGLWTAHPVIHAGGDHAHSPSHSCLFCSHGETASAALVPVASEIVPASVTGLAANIDDSEICHCVESASISAPRGPPFRLA